VTPSQNGHQDVHICTFGPVEPRTSEDQPLEHHRHEVDFHSGALVEGDLDDPPERVKSGLAAARTRGKSLADSRDNDPSLTSLPRRFFRLSGAGGDPPAARVEGPDHGAAGNQPVFFGIADIRKIAPICGALT
tara:strand:- start:65 stop:463 length:399 start_codon:yes stop_codon:yes gene_type:complete